MGDDWACSGQSVAQEFRQCHGMPALVQRQDAFAHIARRAAHNVWGCRSGASPRSVGHITILQAPGRKLTKSYHVDDRGQIVKSAYDGAAEFRSVVVEYDGINGLAAVVRDLQRRPDRCVINAAPGRWNPGPDKPVLRRLYAAVELADDRGKFQKPARSGLAAEWQQREVEAGRLRQVTVLPMFEEIAVDHVLLDFDGVTMPAASIGVRILPTPLPFFG